MASSLIHLIMVPYVHVEVVDDVLPWPVKGGFRTLKKVTGVPIHPIKVATGLCFFFCSLDISVSETKALQFLLNSDFFANIEQVDLHYISIADVWCFICTLNEHLLISHLRTIFAFVSAMESHVISPSILWV